MRKLSGRTQDTKGTANGKNIRAEKVEKDKTWKERSESDVRGSAESGYLRVKAVCPASLWRSSALTGSTIGTDWLVVPSSRRHPKC